MVKISVVVPVYNEAKNVSILHKRIDDTLKSLTRSYEIIFIDDGSKDQTLKELKKLKHVVIIRFRKNFGQSAAMDAGFKQARGKLIVSMDGDLQNDPADIPRMVRHLEENDLDVVCGWRHKRKDSFEKRIFSKIANTLRNMLIRDPVHDSGCSLRVYRRECFEHLDLMGEMHRYIPALLRWQGFSIGEVKVAHYPRKFGKTKYSATRVVKGFLDLFTVWFWRKFSSRPVHIFGALGLVTAGFGGVLGLYAAYLKIFYKVNLSNTFLPDIAVFMMLLGVQFFIFGILADIMVKTYYKAHRSAAYSIKEVIHRR